MKIATAQLKKRYEIEKLNQSIKIGKVKPNPSIHTSMNSKRAAISDDSINTESSQIIKQGKEVKAIEGWTECKDEIEELKKIFFEFLKRWIDSERHKIEPNKPIIYQNASDSEPFELE